MLEVFKNAVCFHTMAHQSVCACLILFVYVSTPRGRFCLFFLGFIEIVFVNHFLQFEAEVFAYFLTTFV